MKRLFSRSLAQTSSVALFSAFLLSSAVAQQPPSPAVSVMTAKSGTFTQTTRLPGRIKASTIAEVRPQVSGIIRERLFEEGTWVNKDQPLYKIEDDSYNASVLASRASVAQAKANYDLAVVEANRAEDLFKANTGSAANRDKAVGNRDAADAALQAAKAQLTSAEIDLDRTTIRSPIAGVIGLSLATTGALVNAQQTTNLATVRALDPIYVDVTQSANDLLNWNITPEGRDTLKAVEITMHLPNGDTFAQKGRLLAGEPQVEPTTGMVTLRVTFPNPGLVLLPGLYVEVEIPKAAIEDTVLVPQNAVMRDANGGTSVWVVEDGIIAVRPIKVEGSSGNNWVTTDGLKDGDQIVTSGFQKAAPGGEVQIVPAEGK